MAVTGEESPADPAAVRRHPILFRTVEKRKNPG